MKPVIHHILPRYKDCVRIQWSLRDPDNAILANHSWRVELSNTGLDDGEWHTRGSGINDVYFVDQLEDSSDDLFEISQLSKSAELWYRVVLVLNDGTEIKSDPVDTQGNTPHTVQKLPGVGIMPSSNQGEPHNNTPFHQNLKIRKRLFLIQRKLIRDAMIALEGFSGTQVAICKHPRFGTRCPSCYNPATKSSVTSRCPECQGTSFKGGYLKPVASLCRFLQAPSQSRETEEGGTTQDRGRIELIDWPRLEREDVVINLANDDRWVVRDQIKRQELRQRIVTQHWSANLLGRNHSAYLIDLSEEDLHS